MDNMDRNQVSVIVITHDDVDDLDHTLSTINYQKQILFQLCNNSPDPSLNITKDDVSKLNAIVEKYELPPIPTYTCNYGTLEFNCELMLGKICCTSKYTSTIEKLVEMVNGRKVCSKPTCDGCILPDLFDIDLSKEETSSEETVENNN